MTTHEKRNYFLLPANISSTSSSVYRHNIQHSQRY